MATQQEKKTTPSDRPSFFGKSPLVRSWSQMGPRFWGGALMGLGFGTFFGNIALPQSGWWGLLTFLVLWMIGLIITNRAINADAVKNANN
jgi:hypothetical protein